MTKILLLCITLFTLGSAAQLSKDQDMDGVPDGIDKCINTPFLDEVNAAGCSTSTLISPEEKDNDSLDVTVTYGFSNNEDLVTRDTQYTSKIQISYYLNNWSYSLRTGYFSSNNDSGLQDTTLKIKRKFKLTKSIKIGFGIGIKLPTYDFTGNNTDYTLYSSVIYYPVSDISLFAGASHTFINDTEITTPLQDTNAFYIGSGYFFTKDFYANILYSEAESKFTTNHVTRSVMGTLYYRINDKWFTTLSYSHEIFDEDLHNSLNIKLGYSIW